MRAYYSPQLINYGRLTALTGADFTNSSTDSYIAPDGTDLNQDGDLGLQGSGPGCVDSNQNGTCDYLE